MSKKQKNFKHPRAYWCEIVIGVVFLTLFIDTTIWGLNKTEAELIEMFGNQELRGGAKQIRAIVIERFLANKWGKTGIMAVPVIGILGSIYFLYKEIFAYVRYIKKSRLFKLGLVSDLYDDYQPTPILKRIKNLFTKKPKQNKRNYPSSKEMQEQLSKNKYYKK